MEILHWLLLALLTGCAAVAALVLALQLKPVGRAETGLLALVLFWGVIVLPIFVLGYLGVLYRAPAAFFSGSLSSGIVATCAWRHGPKQLITALRRWLHELLRLAPDGVRVCWEAKSLSLLGVAGAASAIVFTAFLTYLAPADESWDGLYYHQPIVGFALQNHGFGLVELPHTLLAQTINGYPKFGEAFSLWFVLFTDKTLLEIGGTLAAPGLLLAIYLLAQRYSGDRASSIGWAAALFFIPGVYSQLRTTMIDIELWFFALAATYFVTKPKFRAQDAFAGLVATAWLVGTKGTGLSLAPPLILVALVRAARLSGERWKVWLPLSSALTLIVTLAALTLVRNYRAFHNPFWPVAFESRVLGLSLRGLATVHQVAPDLSLAALLAHAYDHPAGGVGDIIWRGYGYAVPWVVFPLGALSLLYCAVVALRGVAARARDSSAENLLLLAFVTLSPLFVTPSISNVRYNLQAVVAAAVALAWLGRRTAPRLHEGALGASIILSAMAFVWCGYFWGLGLHLKDIAGLAAHSKAERASMNFSSFQMPAAVAQLREAELGPGDVAAFTRDLTFIGVLWNDSFSNRVAYASSPGGRALLAELVELNARWVAVGERSLARRTLDHSADYEYVGIAAQQDKTVIYRRRRAAQP